MVYSDVDIKMQVINDENVHFVQDQAFQ